MNLVLLICVYIEICSDLIHSSLLSALIMVSYNFTFSRLFKILNNINLTIYLVTLAKKI